jgi:hypothetical protein
MSGSESDVGPPERQAEARAAGARGAFAAASATAVVIFGSRLVLDRKVDGASPESVPLAVLGLLVLVVIVAVSTVAVIWISRGRWARGTTVGLVAVVLIVLAAGESFAVAEAGGCGCEVGRRHGTAEALWLAFDTIPILKINETLGWDEPQPLSAVASPGDPSDTPVRRWLAALIVRFAVGFVLLAIAKGLFDLVRSPAGPYSP